MRPLTLPRPGAQRQVEALVDQLAHRVGIDAFGHDHAGQHRRVDGRVGALDRQAPGPHRAAHAFTPAPMPRERPQATRGRIEHISAGLGSPYSRLVLGVYGQ